MLKRVLKVKIVLFNLLTLLTSPVLAGTYDVAPAPGQGIKDLPLGIPIRELGGPTGLLTILIQTAIIIASIGFFVYLTAGGIRWLTSGGDKVALQGARDSIVHALTGLIIIIAAYSTIRILEAAFGLSIISGIKFPSPIP